MYIPRASVRRISPLLRPLRPPNIQLQPPKPRLFTQNSQLLLISQPALRPQVPFLNSPRHLPARNNVYRLQLARLLTTERKRYLIDELKRGIKIGAGIFTVLVLVGIIAIGVHDEKLQRQFPSPPEWSFMAARTYRSARAQEDPEFNGTGITDWASTANMFRHVLRRLEDPKRDGKGLVEQEEGGILVPGAGKAGYDLTAKSEPWRRGYFETLMHLARCAEHLDTWVRDKTRNRAFPANVVIGPSNPNPRPCPPGALTAPLEENCEPAWEGPESYYVKVLTSKGFSTRQRVDAALAYGDWLDYKGLHDTAAEMYRWGIDIASSALPAPSQTIVDPSTGVLRSADASSPTPITPNLAHATTQLALHHARTGAVDKALPIFLSVLRAYRSAPLAPPTATLSRASSSDAALSDAGLMALASSLLSFLRPARYPDPPPLGDEPLARAPGTGCDEAGLMTYIGEILFATSPGQREAGLRWTREAVEAAERGVRSKAVVAPVEKARCAECLETGLSNMVLMLERLAKEEGGSGGGARAGAGKQGGSWSGFWSAGQRGAEGGEAPNWAEEAKEAEEKLLAFRRKGLRETFEKSAAVAGSTWVG